MPPRRVGGQAHGHVGGPVRISVSKRSLALSARTKPAKRAPSFESRARTGSIGAPWRGLRAAPHLLRLTGSSESEFSSAALQIERFAEYAGRKSERSLWPLAHHLVTRRYVYTDEVRAPKSAVRVTVESEKTPTSLGRQGPEPH